jgi:hypothetical protein
VNRGREPDPRVFIQLINTVPKFELGQVVATRGAIDALTQEEINRALFRHHRGD